MGFRASYAERTGGHEVITFELALPIIFSCVLEVRITSDDSVKGLEGWNQFADALELHRQATAGQHPDPVCNPLGGGAKAWRTC